MAHVGCETFLQGRQLQSLAHEFPRIPFSSLYDAQHKFLFYFGHFHRQSAPVLTDWFRQHGGSTWLIDATLEAGTPMYFGVYEAQDNLLLDAYRIPSENVDALTLCLTQTADRFGKPRRTLHDLSEAMAAACERALQGVPHRVCQFHFLRDIGEDLYAVPQARLRDRLPTRLIRHNQFLEELTTVYDAHCQKKTAATAIRADTCSKTASAEGLRSVGGSCRPARGRARSVKRPLTN